MDSNLSKGIWNNGNYFLNFADLLPGDSFRTIMADHLTSKDGEGWEPSWIVRYSVLIKCRGIIKTKGYVVKAVRNIGIKSA